LRLRFVVGRLSMARLLPGRDRLLLIPELHEDPAPRERYREVLLSEPAHQVEGLARRLALRQRHRVDSDTSLDCLAHLRRRTEESIRRHLATNPLMRATEVVGLDEEAHSPLAVRVVREYRPRQKLFPQRLPEPLDLAERLGVVRAALQVLDTLTPKLLRKFRLPSPRHVLATLVRQHLARRSVLRDPTSQRLHHQRRALMVRHHQRHQVPRVVVHEGRHVQPLVPSQQKREYVRLPQLVRLRSLKRLRLRLLLSYGLRHSFEDSFLMQDATHALLRQWNPFEAFELVP
jgi:hypothetical protein